MGVIIESEVWEPNKALFIFLFGSCFASIFFLPHFTPTRHSSPFDRSVSSSFIRFQRKFIILFSLSSVMEGFWPVIGEYESAYFGIDKEQIVLFLCLGFATALLLGTFSGMLSDLIGPKKLCLAFCVLQILVGLSKRSFSHPSLWFANICLSLASSIFSFSFETWMVVDHGKLGHRQDTLNEVFWLMIFTESASFIGSQVMGNWLIGDTEKSLFRPSAAVILFAIISIIFISQGWKEVSQIKSFQNYITSFNACIFNDKRIWLLSCAQACLQFSISVFWLLWAPTIVADGREVNLGLIYPCLLGARMLGSTAFPWFYSGPLSLRTEDFLTYVFVIMGLLLSIVAYDYEEVGILVTLFCSFLACVGLALPSLAKLRTMYVPNELRGGMISLSLAPANAAILFFLVQTRASLHFDLWVTDSLVGNSLFEDGGKRGVYQNFENSTILAFAAVGLLSAASCMHFLKRLGKQPHQSWHKS